MKFKGNLESPYLLGKRRKLSWRNFMRKLLIKRVAKDERRMPSGCPSASTSSCGVNYRS